MHPKIAQQNALADLSTINIEKLHRLPVYDVPQSYNVSDSMGAACFLDAPGYPSYFLRSVYDRRGNTPNGAPEYVIVHDDVVYVVVAAWKPGDTWEKFDNRRKLRLLRLWNPLPLEHPRVQAWIDYVYGYFKDCYADPTKPGETRYNAGELVIGSIKDAAGWAKVLGIDTDGLTDDEITHEVHVRTYRPVTYVQEFYPDYVHTDRNGKYGGGGDWWETLAEQPTPDACPGEHRWSGYNPHPINKSWCQVCGWKESK